MNVPAIRKALERVNTENISAARGNLSEFLMPQPNPVVVAVVRVGLRACDAIEQCRKADGSCCIDNGHVIRVIANILREANVEVKG